MLTFWCYRLGAPHQIFQFSLMMAISIDSLFGGHHIPEELTRTKLSSYHSWEVHAQAAVLKSTEQLDILEGAYPAGLVSQRSFKVTI